MPTKYNVTIFFFKYRNQNIVFDTQPCMRLNFFRGQDNFTQLRYYNK